MKPVDQTTFGAVGNCFSACVASLLHLSIDDVPWFNGFDDWWAAFVTWCAERDLFPVFLPVGTIPRAPAGYSIAGGPVTRSDRLHAVIALNGVTVHDPNPCRAGLIEIQDYIVLLPLVSG